MSRTSLSVLFVVSLLIPFDMSIADGPIETAGTIGKRAISLREVDQRGMASSYKSYQAVYEARVQALDDLAREYLFEQEAMARRISTDELKRQLAPPATEADAQEWYNNNQDRVRSLPFAEVKANILELLSRETQDAAVSAFVETLMKKTKLTVVLEPPRLDVNVLKSNPVMGPTDAPVQIVEFFDYQCRYCDAVRATLEDLQKTYGGKVRIVLRHSDPPPIWWTAS